MEMLLGKMKDFFYITLMGVLSIAVKFDFAFIALFVGFAVNFITGIAADSKVKHDFPEDESNKGFSLEKATKGVKLFGFYVVIIFFLFATTYFKPDLPESLIVYFTLFCSYFYLVNIFRNAKIIFPGEKAIEFFYDVLSTEVFLKLKEFAGLRTRREKHQQ